MKNRILSVFCAIAMLATMMSAFVVTASAADTPAITLTVLKEATAEEPAEIQLGYEGLAEGSKIAGMSVVLPLDTTKFTFVEGTSEVGGEIVFGKRTGSVKATFLATAASQYITKTSGVIGTFKLALAEGVAAGQTYELATLDDETMFTLATEGASVDVKMSGKVSLSTGEVAKPTIPDEPAIPTEAYIYAKLKAQPEKAGDEVEFELSYANLPEGSKIAGMSVVLPIDTDKVTFVEGTSEVGGEIVFGKRTESVKATFLATAASQYITETSGVIGTFKLKLADTLAVGEDITLAFKADETMFTLATDGASQDLLMKGIASTIRVGSGGDEPTPPTGDVTIELDKTTATAKAGADVEIKATVTGADNTDVTATATAGKVAVNKNVVTVTVPADAKTGDKITVTVKAKADENVTATCEITVNNPVYDITGKAEDIKMNVGSVKMFRPTITVDNSEEFAAKFEDATQYRIVFDFTTSNKANAGYAMMVVTGAQIKAIAKGEDAGIYANVSGAANATLHIEDTNGNIK